MRKKCPSTTLRWDSNQFEPTNFTLKIFSVGSGQGQIIVTRQQYRKKRISSILIELTLEERESSVEEAFTERIASTLSKSLGQL